MKKILFVAAAAAMLAMTACGEGGSAVVTAPAKETEAKAAEVKETEAKAPELNTVEKGKLVMVTNAEFEPWEYMEGGKIIGIDAEIAEAIAGKLGLTLEIENTAFDSIIPELASGKGDIGIAGMTVTEDRKQNVDFTQTYAKAAQVIIVPEAADVKGLADLKDMKIGVAQGFTGDLLATEEFGDDHIERYMKGMEAVQALSQGKIDAVIIDSQPAKAYVKQVSGLKIVDDNISSEEYAMAVKKGNKELLEAVDKAITELKEDGTIDKIMDKYIPAE